MSTEQRAAQRRAYFPHFAACRAVPRTFQILSFLVVKTRCATYGWHKLL